MRAKKKAEKSPEEFEFEFLSHLAEKERANVAHTAQMGEQLQNLYDNGTYAFLDAELFAPIQQAMFDALNSNAIDPFDGNQMAQWKALVQSIKQIKLRWQNKIQAGILARQTLLDSTTSNGGETA